MVNISFVFMVSLVISIDNRLSSKYLLGYVLAIDHASPKGRGIHLEVWANSIAAGDWEFNPKGLKVNDDTLHNPFIMSNILFKVRNGGIKTLVGQLL